MKIMYIANLLSTLRKTKRKAIPEQAQRVPEV